MTTERDTRSHIVLSWLREDAHENVERVLLSALDEVDTTPQRRSWWPAWRSRRMNVFTKAAIGAAAVLVVAVVGLRFLPASSIGPGGPPSPTPTPSPSVQVTFPPLSGNDLTPGTYRGVVSKLSLAFTVTVPQGWDGFEDVGLGAHDNRPPTLAHGLLFWRVENLYVDPLQPGAGTLDPPVGPTVDDLVTALASHGGWTTTEPIAITVGGHAGQQLELTVPADADFQGCDSGGNSTQPFAIWTEGGGSWRCMQGPGQTDRIYILDVDGERVVITLVGYPDLGGTYLRDLEAMIDSLEFETTP